MRSHDIEQFAFVLAVTGIFCSLIVTSVWLYMRLRQREAVFQMQSEAFKTSVEKDIFKIQLAIQEQTLQHVAREIHDNIGQLISLARIHLADIESGPDPVAGENVKTSSALLAHALSELRDLSKSLSDDIIRAYGLEEAILMQIGHLEQLGKFRIGHRIAGDFDRLGEEKALALFRIFQESTTNIIKHACATEVCVELQSWPDRTQLSIADNGKGFESQAGKRFLSGGLGNMQKRSRLIDADLRIESEKNKGTRITLVIGHNHKSPI